MSNLKYLTLTGLQLTRIKLALLLSFSFLMVTQLFVGFKSFEDYLIGFVYILFLNDLYVKVRRPEAGENFLDSSQHAIINRSSMSIIFLVLFSLPFLLDVFNVTDVARSYLYKLGFVLWGQVFLLDSYMNYKTTKAKQWLVITNLAGIILILGSII